MEPVLRREKLLDIEKIMKLRKFFEILDKDGEDAAVAWVEEETGEKIEDEEAIKKPSLRLVD